MKTALFFICLIFSFYAFSQETETSSQSHFFTTVAVYNTYGYIDGIRLDSLPSVYATFERYGSDGITFDYGQTKRKRREAFITDNKGEPLVFSNTSLAFLLNFFRYNHWDYIDTYVAPSSGGGSFSYIILKKQP